MKIVVYGFMIGGVGDFVVVVVGFDYQIVVFGGFGGYVE